MEALEAGKTIDKAWLMEGHLQGQLLEVMKLFRANNVIWKSVPNERLNHLVKGNHQGVIVAISAVEFASLENVIADAYEKGEDPFILVLDGVTDVRNFGAIANGRLRRGSCNFGSRKGISSTEFGCSSYIGWSVIKSSCLQNPILVSFH